MSETSLAVLPPNSEVDPVEFVRDRIPEFDGDNGPLKQRYLMLRVFDFGVIEALELCQIKLKTLHHWRERDREFREWEAEELPKRQRGLQVDITLSQFYRNMWLSMGIDAQVLGKAWLKGVGELTKAEQDYLNRVRVRYSPESLVSMLRIATGDLSPEKGLTVNTVIIMGPQGQPVAEGEEV